MVKRGKVPPKNNVWYLDAVEEAICFGWIDSTLKTIDRRSMQRFSPRTRHSTWSELNKERYRRLERLGLMTKAGQMAEADHLNEPFEIDPDILARFQKCPDIWKLFQGFPERYQRIRLDFIQREKKRNRPLFEKRLNTLLEWTAQGKLLGHWDDYGRLSHD